MDATREELLIETEEIKKLMDLSSSLFNIRTAFVYAIDDERYTSEIAGNNGDYQEYCRIIQQELKHKCISCDRDKFREANRKREPVLYQCYNGLYEMFLPLYIENSLAGYLHFGQVRSEKDFQTVARECSLHEHPNIAELERAYSSMNIIHKEKLALIAELFGRFAHIILKDKLVELRKANPETYLKKYIEENLDKPIDVKTAAGFIGRSSSFVTHNFKVKYNMTFHEYLSHKRVEHSKVLLRKHSILETYPLCGFKNRYHFSKVFKKLEGMTPGEYKFQEGKK